MIVAFLAILPAAVCGECHREEEAEWKMSRHAEAATNALFRVSYRAEPMRWCLGCHAPSGDAGEGVGCTSCHRAHRQGEGERLRTAELCGECHQFNFPIGKTEPVRMSDHPMQNTLVEWRASQASREGKSCASCHAAAGDHRMAGGHDVDLLRRSLSVSAARIEHGELRVKIEARGAGHEVPTGDPFRRLVLSICQDPECAVELEEVELGRTFERRNDTWTMVRNDALLPDRSREIELKVRAAVGSPVFYCLSIAYAARGLEQALAPAEREAVITCGSAVDGR